MRALWLPLLSACSGAKVSGPDSLSTDSGADSGTEVVETGGETAVDTGSSAADGEDFAVLNVASSELHMYWNEGGAIAPTGGNAASLPYTDATYALGDFDGDGLDDLWVAEPVHSDFTLSIYANEGGLFSGSATYSSGVDLNPKAYAFAVGDFNGDGRADFAAMRMDSQKMFLYPNQGGSFDFTATNKSVTGVSEAATWLSGDVDGDGTDELIAVDGTSLVVFPVTGGTTLGTPLFSDTLPAGYQIATLDLNADGRTDLALWNGGALVVRPSTGTAFDSATAQAFTVSDSGVPVGGNLR